MTLQFTNNKTLPLRSDTWKVVVVRLLGPLFLSGLLIPVFRRGLFLWCFLLALPFMVLAAFQASLAVVRIRDGKIRYRRLLRWVDINSRDVLSSGVALPPLIGYIRLNHSVFPWHKLYFVLDRGVQAIPFRMGEYAILNFLKHEQGPRSAGHESRVGHQTHNWFKLAVAGFAGVGISLLLRYITPTYPPDQGNPSPMFITAPEKLWEMFSRADVAGVFVVSMLVLAIFMRHKPKSWTFAFLAGLSLPAVFIR